MISTDKITEIFCSIDDFCIVFEPALQKRLLSTGKKTRNRAFTMSMSEVVTITVLFHLSGIRTFKHFYLFYVQKHLKKEFPNTVSYNRFVELMQSNMLPLTLYILNSAVLCARIFRRKIRRNKSVLTFDLALNYALFLYGLSLIS
jgi:hypothetical protein